MHETRQTLQICAPVLTCNTGIYVNLSFNAALLCTCMCLIKETYYAFSLFSAVFVVLQCYVFILKFQVIRKKVGLMVVWPEGLH